MKVRVVLLKNQTGVPTLCLFLTLSWLFTGSQDAVQSDQHGDTLLREEEDSAGSEQTHSPGLRPATRRDPQTSPRYCPD